MKAEQEIKSLIRECVAYLMEEGYSEPRIADYQRLWRNGIIWEKDSKLREWLKNFTK